MPIDLTLSDVTLNVNIKVTFTLIGINSKREQDTAIFAIGHYYMDIIPVCYTLPFKSGGWNI